MSDEKVPLITVEDIQGRIAEIDAEQDEIYQREYQYSYMPDKMYMAKLYQEKTGLEKVLKVLSEFSLEDIQKELDKRDPFKKADYKAEGLARYSFDVLGHAEKVLQHQDKELQARVDLGERVIEQWEKNIRNLSWEETDAVYALIRDKDIPMDALEEKIRKKLILGDEELQKDLVDIGGIRCLKVAAWQDGVDSYVLGNAVDSGDFYYAEVNGSICNAFEYDFKPSKEQVEDDWLNLESMREIDRQEAWAQAWPGDREAIVSGDELHSGKAAGATVREGFNMNDRDIFIEFGFEGRSEMFRYQMLSRLQSDCDYYLGNGNRHPKHLWAGNEKDQIACMKALWNSFPADGKPEWLSLEQIDGYEKQLAGIEVLFTFGTAKQFPFEMGYVSITAPSVKMAIEEFRRNYPDHNEGLLNCADYYYTAESVAKIKEHGNGNGCHRAIVVTVADKSIDAVLSDAKARTDVVVGKGREQERGLE